MMSIRFIDDNQLANCLVIETRRKVHQRYLATRNQRPPRERAGSIHGYKMTAFHG